MIFLLRLNLFRESGLSVPELDAAPAATRVAAVVHANRNDAQPDAARRACEERRRTRCC